MDHKQIANLKEFPVIKGLDFNDIQALHNTFFNGIQTREDVLEYEEVIKNMPGSFDECPYPLFHSFADGMYTREIHFNKGDLIVGAIHKNEYFVNVLKGRIWIVSEFGAKEIIAPASFKAKAGVKHIGFTLEDTVWSDTHKVEADNAEDAEKEIFAESYDDIGGEYIAMCEDIGLTPEEVRDLSEQQNDLIGFPNDLVEIRESSVEGVGVFMAEDIQEGQIVAAARAGDKRTMVGRFVNHSDKPNVSALVEYNIGYFVAIRELKKGEEIFADYRDVREKSALLDRGELCLDG